MGGLGPSGARRRRLPLRQSRARGMWSSLAQTSGSMRSLLVCVWKFWRNPPFLLLVPNFPDLGCLFCDHTRAGADDISVLAGRVLIR